MDNLVVGEGSKKVELYFIISHFRSEQGQTPSQAGNSLAQSWIQEFKKVLGFPEFLIFYHFDLSGSIWPLFLTVWTI